MTSTTHRTTEASSSSLRNLAIIDAKRFARHPAFIVSTLLTLAFPILFAQSGTPGDLLSWTVTAAFFTGLPCVVIAARLTRSQTAAEEAFGISPSSESTRTWSMVLACLVPFAVGIVWLVEAFAVIAVRGHHRQEWWFGTVPATDVIAIMVAGGPVACLGGALVGVMVGRWLKFPGAPAVAMVLLLLSTLLLGGLTANALHLPTLHVTPWTSWQGGTQDDGTAEYYPGSPAWYVLYTLCLCATAAIAAVWHDRDARTSGLKKAIAVVSVLLVVSVTLTAVVGPRDTRTSAPVPEKIKHSGS